MENILIQKKKCQFYAWQLYFHMDSFIISCLARPQCGKPDPHRQPDYAPTTREAADPTASCGARPWNLRGVAELGVAGLTCHSGESQRCALTLSSLQAAALQREKSRVWSQVPGRPFQHPAAE